jgi:Dna[CI] antecedent, DciA
LRKLAAALAGWAPENRPHDPLALLEAGWPEIVGAEVARNSHPSRIVDGSLLVITRSSAWGNQLSFLADHVRRAVAARLPKAGIERLRFRVGRVPDLSGPSTTRARVRSRHPAAERPATLSPAEALTRFRQDVEARQESRRKAGWNECAACGALEVAAPGEWCAACAAERAGARAEATARLLFEAPWLGYAGTASLVKGLQEEEYERIRAGLLKHWWGKLARARAARQLSRDGSERIVASSYVLLQSKLPPEEIMSATVRGILGDELHELLYGEPAREGGAVKRQKRRE